MYWQVLESVLTDAALRRSLRLRAAMVTRQGASIVWEDTLTLRLVCVSEMKRHHNQLGLFMQQGSQLTPVNQCTVDHSL